MASLQWSISEPGPPLNRPLRKTSWKCTLLEGGRNCYDETLHLRFIKRLRDERVFDNLDGLKSQLQIDSDAAIRCLNEATHLVAQ